MKLRIERTDDGVFVALPDHLLAALGVSVGDMVDVAINEDGSVRIDADRDFNRTMAIAEEVMLTYADTLRTLAKS